VEAYDRAVAILTEDREILDRLARLLLDKEVVDRKELRELMGSRPENQGNGARPETGHVPAPSGD
jgi:ATP-dependent Zn protease